MCHSYDARRWSRTTEDDPEEPGEPEDDPSFLDEEPADDVELLTDGGDDD